MEFSKDKYNTYVFLFQRNISRTDLRVRNASLIVTVATYITTFSIQILEEPFRVRARTRLPVEQWSSEMLSKRLGEFVINGTLLD